MAGPWRWLLGSAAVLAICVTIAVSAAGCTTCEDPPPDGCFAPPGATHQEACASCGPYYTGCREGKWVNVSCSTATLPRDAGRP